MMAPANHQGGGAMQDRNPHVAARSDSGASGARRCSVSSPLLWPLCIFAISRVVVFGSVAIAGVLRHRDLLSSLAIWDGMWYLSAAHGYSLIGYILHPIQGALPGQSNMAFLPVLPLSIRAVSAITGLHALEAGILVVHVYGAALAVLLWQLIVRLTDKRVANRSVALFWFFPGAVVLSMIYAESALLVFAVVCLLALLDGRWVTAGIFAALAGAARPTGIVLVACCLWQAGRAIRRNHEWQALAAPVLAPLGMAAYFVYLWIETGQPDMWIQIERAGWGGGVDFGRQTMSGVVSAFREPASINTSVLLQLTGVAVVLVGGFFMWRWRPSSLIVVYTAGVLAMTLLSRTEPVGGFRPRLVLVAFPLIVSIAHQVRGRAFLILLVGSAASLAGAAIVYTAQGWVIP
jgi:hypothetical protein